MTKAIQLRLESLRYDDRDIQSYEDSDIFATVSHNKVMTRVNEV